MANYCLPRSLVAKFVAETAPGKSLDPYALNTMDSASRRRALEAVLGDVGHAKEVNAIFEEKMLLRYKNGLDDWVNRVKAPEATKKILADKINALDPKVLNPATSKAFLEDLAEKSLGLQVTETEAKQIFQTANRVKQAQADWEATMLTPVTSKEYFRTVRGKQTYTQAVDDAVKARSEYGQSVMALNSLMSEINHEPDFVNAALSIAYAPKTLETGFLHLSAFGVQLWGSMLSPETWSGFAEQVKYFRDEKNYQQLQQYIISHPYYNYALQAKLGLTDIKGLTKFREEDMQSPLLQAANTWLAKKTGLPINVFAASGRAFTGYLNYVRFNSFVRYTDAIRNINPDHVYTGSPLLQDAANVINNLSGRGNIGKADEYAGVVPGANTILFTARKTWADLQMMNPGFYATKWVEGYKTGNYEVAKRATIQGIGMFGLATATLGIINAMQPFGVKASLNPIAQDFGMVTFPNGQKTSIMGPDRTLLRLAFRLAENKMKTNAGEEVQLGGEGPMATSRGELVLDEIRNKLGPAAGYLTDFLLGKDAVGREFSVPLELRGKLEPIVMKNMIDYWYAQPDKALSDIPLLLAAGFGVPIQNPLPPGERAGLSAWGENYTASWMHDPEHDIVDTELKKIGIKPKFPPRVVNGVKLTDDQYKAYITLAGQDSKQRLTALIGSRNWENTPVQAQKMQAEMIMETSKQTAQIALYKASFGTKDDILSKSLDKMKTDLNKQLGNPETEKNQEGVNP
jgi:hypothetical protein